MLYHTLLIIGCVAMFFGLYRSRNGHPQGAAITGIAALFCVTIGALRILFPPGVDVLHPVKVQETEFAAIAAERLGMHLAEHHAGADVIVIMPFEWRTDEDKRAAMSAALLRGLSDKVQVVATIDPPLPLAVKQAYESRYHSADMEQVEIPDFASWFNAAYLDQLLAGPLSGPVSGKPLIIVSLAGLPEDSAKLKCLGTAHRPKLAMVFGPVHALQPLLASKVLVAATDHHPSPNHQARPPMEDKMKAFDRRYLLITPENLADMRRLHFANQ